MATGLAFSKPMITEIKQRCPELEGYALIVDPFEHGDLASAISSGLEAAEPIFAEQVRDQLAVLPNEHMAAAEKLFGNANAFSLPLDLKPGELLPVNILQPIQFIFDPFQTGQLKAHKAPWHGDLGADRDQGAIDAQAKRFMRQAAWHEAGHAVSYDSGHLTAPSLKDLAKGDQPGEQWAEAVRRNAGEQYADGFSLRQLGQSDRAVALQTAQELADFRTIAVVSSLMRGHTDHIHHVTSPAIRAAITDILTRSDDSAADATAATWHRDPMDQANMAAIAGLTKKLQAPSEFGDTAILLSLAEAGRQTENAAVYVLMRDYAEAMGRLLPAAHPNQRPFAQVSETIASNPKAVTWDSETPSIEAMITAAKLRNQRAAKPSHKAMRQISGPPAL